MKQIRQFHLYLGTFFAPVIFFFAFSDALQTFGLHESEKDGSYNAPAWIATMAQVHKDQRLEGEHHSHEDARRSKMRQRMTSIRQVRRMAKNTRKHLRRCRLNVSSCCWRLV